jgi:hypothetical protein
MVCKGNLHQIEVSRAHVLPSVVKGLRLQAAPPLALHNEIHDKPEIRKRTIRTGLEEQRTGHLSYQGAYLESRRVRRPIIEYI